MFCTFTYFDLSMGTKGQKKEISEEGYGADHLCS